MALVIYALICISAVVIAVETVPALSPTAKSVLAATELVILALFSVEYILRLTCSPHPLRYAFSFWGIVDFVAIVPAVLFLFPDLTTVRSLRLLRLLRILKLFRANRALDRIGAAFDNTKSELAILYLSPLSRSTSRLSGSTISNIWRSRTRSGRSPKACGGRSRRFRRSAMAMCIRSRRAAGSSPASS